MTNSTEPNCFVGSVETHLASSLGYPVHAEETPVCIKHMDKHTDTHISTYDTHVDRMKDGKIASIKQRPCDHFPIQFYSFASDVGPIRGPDWRFEGIQKE